MARYTVYLLTEKDTIPLFTGASEEECKAVIQEIKDGKIKSTWFTPELNYIVRLSTYGRRG